MCMTRGLKWQDGVVLRVQRAGATMVILQAGLYYVIRIQMESIAATHVEHAV